MNRRFHILLYWLALCLSVGLGACERDEMDPITGQPSEEKINLWILENMNLYYYWQDKLPKAFDYRLKPDRFFESLLYRYDPVARPDGDRFSWIQESVEDLKSSLGGELKTTGMEFRLYRKAAGSSEILGVVLYVIENSPAARQGIKRGDLFTKVNDQVLTISNYTTLLTGHANPLKLQFVELEEGKSLENLSDGKVITVEQVTLQENPILVDTLLQFGDRKIGYLVYNQFNPSPYSAPDASIYDKALAQFTQSLKGQGVNEFILDLRYNGGGYVSSALQLASLLAPQVTSKDIFTIKEYNATMTKALTEQYGKNYFTDYFLEKNESIGNQLSRLFVLTTQSTASASELVINGLKPYMQVIVVGDTTVGKNVGSVTISDPSKKIKWGLQPIVNKSFNSLKQSDYTAGFIPDLYVRETVRLYPFADARDGHLQEVLKYLHLDAMPNARKMTTGVQEETQNLQEVGNTIRQKTGGYNMFEEVKIDYSKR